MRWFIELLPIQNASHTRNIWKKSSKKEAKYGEPEECVCVCAYASMDRNMQMSATRKINVIIYLHRFVENHYKSHSDHFFLQKNNAFCLNKYTRERKNSSLNVNGHEIEGKKAKQFLWVNDKWMLTAGLFPNPYSSVIPNMTSISHLRTKRNMHSPLEKRALLNERDTFLFSTFIQKYESYTDWSPHYYRWRSFQYCKTECVPDIIIWCGDDIIPEGSRTAITIFFRLVCAVFGAKRSQSSHKMGRKRERARQTWSQLECMWTNMFRWLVKMSEWSPVECFDFIVFVLQLHSNCTSFVSTMVFEPAEDSIEWLWVC